MTLHRPAVSPDRPRNRVEGGLLIGRVARVSPLHVIIDGRDHGPLVATRASASGLGLAVGDQVLLAPVANDLEQLVVIDGVA